MLAPGRDADRVFENAQRERVDTLAALLAEPGQAAAELVGDTADGELFRRACMISQR